MNHRPNDLGPARPARRRPRPPRANVSLDHPDEPGSAAPRVLFWGDAGALPAANPAADRPWDLATLAILIVVILAAVGPLIPG